jgi:hypothetical protein
MSPSDSAYTVECGKTPRQIDDLAAVRSRSDPVPQWDIRYVLPQLELDLLAYLLLSNKVVCLDPRVAQRFELGAARPTGRATLAVPPDGGVARGIEIVHTIENAMNDGD